MEKHIRFSARIPEGIVEWLREAARKSDRSMHGQMVNVLREAKNQEEKENAAK